MKHEDLKQDTPRLVVMYHSPAPGQETFQWGMVGQLPLHTTIGYIARVQRELCLEDEDHGCEQSALVLAWDGTEFDYFVHPDIPVDLLVGMLETIKAALVDSLLVQQQARNQQVAILGADGQPVRRIVQ